MALGPNINFNVSLKKIPQATRNYVVEASLLVVMGVLFWWFLVIPKQAAVSQQKSQLASLQNQAGQISAAAGTFQELVQKLNQNQASVADLDQALPLEGRTPEVYLLLQNLAQSVGVSVGSLGISSQEAGAVTSGDKSLLKDPYGPAALCRRCQVRWWSRVALTKSRLFWLRWRTAAGL